MVSEKIHRLSKLMQVYWVSDELVDRYRRHVVANANFGTLHYNACCYWTNTLWVDQSALECQMSKRKPAMALKHAHSPRMAAKAQRSAQAIVRSPKNERFAFRWPKLD